MLESDIKIDKEGIWYYRGAHMFRKDILCIFFENLNLDDCGRYFVQLNQEICYLDVEDTAFVISAVYKTENSDGGHEQIEIVLNDDSRETLDLTTLAVGKDNVMYCRIKEGKFPARFSRKSYYQLAQCIRQDDAEDNFYICLNNQKFMIRNQ
jgi:hypothetical protein